jgi:MFS family permease
MSSDAQPRKSRYPIYVLILCLLVYISNTADRQILAVLAQSVKHDLGVSDADMGFLLGTAFAVFYAVFGVPAGRLGDLWSRKGLIATGLVVWSAFTALSGFAQNFALLSVCRIGVGVGESTSSPPIYSILYDYFTQKWRATVFAVYSAGVFIGAGCGMIAGGAIADRWAHWFPVAATVPLGLKGWQVAFFAVGAPGVFLAIAISKLREPPRTARHTLDGPAESSVGVLSVLPVFSFVTLVRLHGIRGASHNLALLGIVALVGYSFYCLTADRVQWLVLGLGFYCIGSAARVLRSTDRDAFDRIIASRSMVLGNLGVAGCVFLTTGLMAWLPSYLQRLYGVSAAEAGAFLGISYGVTGLLGSLLGGAASDLLSRWVGDRSKLTITLISYLLSIGLTLAIVAAHGVHEAYMLCIPLQLTTAMYLGPVAANVNSLVPQRMRATASAFYIATVVLFGSSMGPYTMGRLSDLFASSGDGPGVALQLAVRWSLLSAIPTVLFLVLGICWIGSNSAAAAQPVSPQPSR